MFEISSYVNQKKRGFPLKFSCKYAAYAHIHPKNHFFYWYKSITIVRRQILPEQTCDISISAAGVQTDSHPRHSRENPPSARNASRPGAALTAIPGALAAAGASTSTPERHEGRKATFPAYQRGPLHVLAAAGARDVTEWGLWEAAPGGHAACPGPREPRGRASS